MKTTSNVKMTLKKKDVIKNEDNLKNEDILKNEDKTKMSEASTTCTHVQKRQLFRQRQPKHKGTGEGDYGTWSHTAKQYSCLQV